MKAHREAEDLFHGENQVRRTKDAKSNE